MENPSDNNNGPITALEEASHIQSSVQSIADPINVLGGDGDDNLTTSGVIKSLQLTKSKKSLKSIVDRLSKQYSPINTDSHQFMAALSLTETSSSPQMFPEQLVHTFHQSPSMSDDQALDLSLKRPPIDDQCRIEEDFQAKTDSIGALDLSVSSSRNRTARPDTGSESPDFVLDLTKPTPTENDDWETSAQYNVQTISNPLIKGPAKDEQDDFQVNHMRVLQFLSHHTIQQKVGGTDIDIELLSCRYCKYASTEKSCMMAHLTTTHVSRKQCSNNRFRYQQQEVKSEPHQPSQPNESRHVTKKQRSEDPPNLVMMNNVQGSYLPQLIQLVDRNNQMHQTILPASLVELAAQSSIAITKVPQWPPYDHSPKKSPRVARNVPSQRRRRSKHLYDSQRPSLPLNHVAAGEEGIYFVPYQQAGSILEERLMSSQVNTSSNLPSTSSSVDKSSNATLTIGSSEEQQRLKLNHLCKKLANRMGIRNQRRGKVQHDNQDAEQGLHNTPKGRRQKSSGGKRQSLIAQTGNFSCEYCSKTFKRPLSLYGHLKQHSPLLKKHRKGLFQCRTCPLTFSSFPDLVQHMQKNKHSQMPIANEAQESTGSVTIETSSQFSAKSAQESYATLNLPVPTTMKKSGKSRKAKPYSLREQARRDYLLDHDPMMMDQKDVNIMSNWKEKLNSNNTVIKINPKGSHMPESMKGIKQKLKLRRVSKDVKHFIKLKKMGKKKKIKVTSRTSSYTLGRSWKTAVRKMREQSSRRHFANVLKYFVRRPKGIQCKLCDAAVKTFWRALLHLKKKHLKVLCKGRTVSKERKLLQVTLTTTTTTTTTKKSPEKAEFNTSSVHESFDNGLYVRMSGTGEQYQCSLCLQLFKGKDSLIKHLEMHKQIYEEGMRSFSTNSGRGFTKKRKVDTREEMVFTDNSEIRLSSEMDTALEMPKANNSSNNHFSQCPEVKLSPKAPKEEGVVQAIQPPQHSISEKSEMPITVQRRKFGSPSKGKQLKKHVFESSIHDGGSKSQKKLLCKICMFPTFSLEDMKRHMRKHCKMLLNCDQCSYQTIERRFIVRHIQTVHEQRRPYTCELCVYSTAYKHHLKRHYKSHSVELLACSMCSFCTLQEGKFQEHMKEHDLSPNIVMCDDCGLTFANAKILKEHRAETHNKQACEDKASSEPKDRAGFAANWWENISMAAIDKEAILEQHRCESCRFFTEDSSTLMNHMLNEHLDLVTCKEEQKDTPHIRNLLTMGLSVQCPQCGFITSKDQLKAHLETHNSNETYACEHCPYETKSLDALQRHKAKHIKHRVSLTCLQCSKVQTDILSLRNHTRVHLVGVNNDNLFRCSLCSFVTNSSADGEFHLDQHNFVMEFKCQVCMYSSPTLSGLTSHRRLHRKLKATTYTLKKVSPAQSHDSI